MEKLESFLGSGHAGLVFSGRYDGKKVAVKFTTEEECKMAAEVAKLRLPFFVQVLYCDAIPNFLRDYLPAIRKLVSAEETVLEKLTASETVYMVVSELIQPVVQLNGLDIFQVYCAVYLAMIKGIRPGDLNPGNIGHAQGNYTLHVCEVAVQIAAGKLVKLFDYEQYRPETISNDEITNKDVWLAMSQIEAGDEKMFEPSAVALLRYISDGRRKQVHPKIIVWQLARLVGVPSPAIVSTAKLHELGLVFSDEDCRLAHSHVDAPVFLYGPRMSAIKATQQQYDALVAPQIQRNPTSAFHLFYTDFVKHANPTVPKTRTADFARKLYTQATTQWQSTSWEEQDYYKRQGKMS